jgi:hypothetical protein
VIALSSSLRRRLAAALLGERAASSSPDPRRSTCSRSSTRAARCRLKSNRLRNPAMVASRRSSMDSACPTFAITSAIGEGSCPLSVAPQALNLRTTSTTAGKAKKADPTRMVRVSTPRLQRSSGSLGNLCIRNRQWLCYRPPSRPLFTTREYKVLWSCRRPDYT